MQLLLFIHNTDILRRQTTNIQVLKMTLIITVLSCSIDVSPSFVLMGWIHIDQKGTSINHKHGMVAKRQNGSLLLQYPTPTNQKI